jgi:3-oxoacyl-[acyl-carrier protein] reductase
MSTKGTLRLKDKVSIITGGAEGIGKSYVLRFAEEGSRVVVADINITAANALVESLKREGKLALALKTDVSKLTDTQEMARKTIEKFGRIDILLNNAAVAGRVKLPRATVVDLDPGEWDRVISVNLKGTFLCAKAVIPSMMAQMSGKIINIASDLAFDAGAPKMTPYIASKGGVMAFTRALAREVGDYTINVNCIAPGSTWSEDPENKEALANRQVVIPLRAFKRLQYPEDIVGTAVFLASSDSDFITGQSIVVNGGIFMH